MAKKNETPKEVPEVVQETAEHAQADGVLPDETVQLTQEEFLKVKAHIETLQKEKEEAIALAQRLQADFDNYRKRNSTLRKDSYDEGIRDCIRALLPTLDNFDRALGNAQGVEAAFVEGVELVLRTMLEALGKQGLKEIDATGVFDANLHNAVMQEEAQGKETGEILEVFQKGYEVDGKILRYSMVKVAQ